MFYRIAADLVVVAHFAFIAFAVGGALLALQWRWMPALHLPAVLWAVLVELGGWTCPLTPLEQRLRLAAGRQGYEGGFIEHYLLPVLYPEHLTRELQFALGGAVAFVNLGLYLWLAARRRKRR
jgi:hypothetical protein